MAKTFGASLRKVLRGRLREVRACAGAARESGADEDWHALRKAIKRLRYNVEIVAVLLGEGAQTLLDDLSEAQECLGTIADAAAFSQTYRALIAELPPGDPRCAGLEARCAGLEREREKARATLVRLVDDDYAEKLAASISSAERSLSNEAS